MAASSSPPQNSQHKHSHVTSQPHPIFVIALVGPEETPFGIQKDFLCAKSTYYKKYFEENPNEGSIENLVRLPDTPVEVFAYAQNFLYTGQVFPNLDNLPTYEVLIGVWKLGHELGIDGLCDATLEAMAECRRVTQHIPATPLLVQVWKDTPEGSSIRKLLLSWAAEYMRSSESRAEFARSLPQEVLSELVVTMSSLDSPQLTQADAPASASASASAASNTSAPASAGQRRPAPNTEPDETEGRAAKKRRGSDTGPNGTSSAAGGQATGRKAGSRASLPSSKPASKSGSKRRSSTAVAGSQQYSSNQKLNFCADLLTRMLSGPGKQKHQFSPQTPHPLSLSLPGSVQTLAHHRDSAQASGHAWWARSGSPLIRSATGCPTTWT